MPARPRRSLRCHVHRERGYSDRLNPRRTLMSLKQKIFVMWLKKNLIWILLAFAAAIAVYFFALK